MARLQWDQTGERHFETGVDHGVLYIYDKESREYNDSHVWNGLTGVTESPSGAEPTPIYADNIKYLNLMSAEEFGATVEAFTYPDEFARCDGSYAEVAGVAVSQQNRELFGMSYRTRVGNDIEGDRLGYKLHLIWGAQAAPSEKAYATVNDTPEALTFSWTLSTTPIPFSDDSDFSDLKPTAHMVIDSRTADRDRLRTFETMLYGGVDTEAILPSPEEVLDHFADGEVVEGGMETQSVSGAPVEAGVASQGARSQEEAPAQDETSNEE